MSNFWSQRFTTGFLTFFVLEWFIMLLECLQLERPCLVFLCFYFWSLILRKEDHILQLDISVFWLNIRQIFSMLQSSSHWCHPACRCRCCSWMFSQLTSQWYFICTWGWFIYDNTFKFAARWRWFILSLLGFVSDVPDLF